MKPMQPRGNRKPESIIQEKIVKYLRGREWVVKSTHGNAYQSGFPDLYCAHARFGQRWVEVKKEDKYQFTTAQLEFFPKLSSVGIGIWILVADTDAEYAKLWQPPNWYQYLPVAKLNTRTRTIIVQPSTPLPGSNRVIRKLVK